jgi:hypothetical protein
VKERLKNITEEEDLNEIEHFFEIAILPMEPIILDKCSTITDVPLFIKTHLSIVRAQKGNTRYQPYMDRLIQLKYIINQNKIEKL